MNSTTEDASSNKRRRSGPATASNRRNAASGGAATAAPPNPSNLDSRLEPLKVMLVTQPDELKGTIISLSKEMLDLRATIKQREESYARFDKPSLNPTTGEIMNDEAGNPLPFIPNSLRSKCPVKPSAPMANEQSMRNYMDTVQATHAAYVTAMANHAKRIAELEIELRQSQLRRQMYKLLSNIALAHDVMGEVMAGSLPMGMKLSRDERVNKIVFDVLADASAKVSAAIGVVEGTPLKMDFCATVNHIDAVIEDKMDESDSEFIKPIITKMCTWLPLLSVDLWEADDAKEQTRKINAALRIALKPKALVQANEDVDAEMNEVDAATNPTRLMDMIRNETQKQVRVQMRKNYSGDAKNQESKPTGNGRESRKNSKAGQQTQRSNPKQTEANSNANKDKKGKSTKGKKKKGQVEQADEPKSTPGSTKRRNQGSQGGSNNGGRRRGAGRR